MNIKKGQMLTIKNQKYEVTGIQGAIDKYDSDKDKTTGKHRAIWLHKLGHSSLHPTHFLKIYHDKKKKLKFSKFSIDKPPKEIKKPKQKGNIFSFTNEKGISLKDIGF